MSYFRKQLRGSTSGTATGAYPKPPVPVIVDPAPGARSYALSGVQSQPTGARVFNNALSGLQEYSLPATGSVKRRQAMGALPPGQGGPPRWYTAMQGQTLGDDDALSEPTLTDPIKLQQETLSTLQLMRSQEARRIEDERMRGYFQLAATLSIPLAAFIWKRLLKKPA